MCAGVRAQKVCTLSKKEFFMKNMKKLLLLVLSLMLLCGIFAVAALAEEPAQEATVVYPDGSTEVVAVGETITPKTFTDGLYYGKGNTLFKDDATEGWSFHLRGTDTALTDLTVTEAMAGKQVYATGADKVYYTSYEKLKLNKDSAVSEVIVYHLKNDFATYFSTANTGDRGDGTNTGATAYSKFATRYDTGTVNSDGKAIMANVVQEIKITLYGDVVSNDLRLFLGTNDKALVNFDLNGHVNNAKYMDWCWNALGVEALTGRCIAVFDVEYDR